MRDFVHNTIFSGCGRFQNPAPFLFSGKEACKLVDLLGYSQSLGATVTKEVTVKMERAHNWYRQMESDMFCVLRV
jgi:hypothetical protein